MNQGVVQFVQWDMHNKRIILRADLNVPIQDGKVLNDFRLQALKPTLQYLLEHKAQIIILTHIGRPTHKDEALSTRNLVPWFINTYGPIIEFAQDINNALKSNAPITILENLRFWQAEQDQSVSFARELAQLGDYYVNDAFGALHRTDTSITLLAEQFELSHRSIGFLIKKELQELTPLRNNPSHPFLAILGGAKIHEKIRFVKKLIGKADAIMLVPALVFTFEKAQGYQVGKSLIDADSLQIAHDILKNAQTKNYPLIFPVDYQIATDTMQGPLSLVAAHAFPAHGIGISIGPQTIDLFAQQIAQAHTIFFNGVFGFLEKKETLQGAQKLMEMIAHSSARSIIAGGDTTAVAQSLGLIDAFSFVSTGGGATVAYIAGEELPGLNLLLPKV